jgi:subtilisin family serine protease
MSYVHRLAMPWARPGSLYYFPGQLALKLALGHAPEHIPAVHDVRIGAREAARQLDGARIDQLLRHFSDQVRITRVHSAAASLDKRGKRHEAFDDVEQATGVARTFLVDVDDDCALADLADALRQVGTVEHVSPNYVCALPFHDGKVTAALDSDEAWASRDQIRAREAMAYEPGDPAVIVAIVDTGVLLEHPELRGHLRSGFNTVDFDSPDLASGLHLVGHWTGPDNDPEDFVGHGTSCAGIMGAAGDEIPPGLAGDCELLPIRVLAAAVVPGREEPVGIGAIYDIDRGVKKAMDLGAKVLNMSFGTPESALQPNDPKPHADVCRYGMARGCVLVAASGNSGKEERFLPAALDGVIAVGAVGPEGKPSPFATTGDHVAVAAPGEKIVSAGLYGYQRASGTSFAAPFVTGTAALLVSRALRRAESLDGRDVGQILRQSARPFSSGVQAPGLGSGILDAVGALRALEKELDRRVGSEGDAGQEL